MRFINGNKMQTILIIIKTQLGVEYSESFQKILSTYCCAIKGKVIFYENDNLKPTTFCTIILYISDKSIVKYLYNDLKVLNAVDIKTVKM